MTKDMVDKIFKLNNNDLKRITFYGGEPFLPQTMSIVKYIISKAPNAMYSATTNGYHLIDFFEILSNLRISNIMVTLDGPKEYHNKTRILKNGGETYDQVTHGIDKFLNNKIPVKIRMNISRDNLKQCMALREEYIHKFKSQYDAGILMFELQPIFQINPETKAELDEAIFYEKVSPNGAPSKYNMMSVTVSPVLNAFINNSKKHFRPRYCHCNAEWKSRFYDAEGNIYSCILALKNTAAAVGTYYPDFFLKQKSMLSRNIESIAQCRECKLKFLCGGGCANAIIDKNGDVMKPNCDMIVNEVYNELPKLFRRYIGTKELPNK
jgi:uncharacterized protein